VSQLSEVLRRFIAHWLIEPAEDLDQQVQRLLPVFSPHLSTMRGMTRRHDDWIIDNLLNPASIGPMLSIADAVATLDGEFEVFGASPRFLVDWRWYKDIAGESDRFNAPALVDYWVNVHNLLDYRGVWAARDPGENRRLYDACVTVRSVVREFERHRDRGILTDVVGLLDAIATSVARFSPATGNAIAELRQTLAGPALDGGAVAASPGFAPWFGRGQQYISFSRRADRKGAGGNNRGDD
jgi:hypothetical protein